MTYVVRDKDGCVISVLAGSSGAQASRLKASNQEIDAMLSQEDAAKELQEVLVASDLSFVRVLEDLIGVLLEKGVIMLTDLPEMAREKMMQRQTVRAYLTNFSDLIDDTKEEDEVFI